MKETATRINELIARAKTELKIPENQPLDCVVSTNRGNVSRLLDIYKNRKRKQSKNNNIVTNLNCALTMDGLLTTD